MEHFELNGNVVRFLTWLKSTGCHKIAKDRETLPFGSKRSIRYMTLSFSVPLIDEILALKDIVLKFCNNRFSNWKCRWKSVGKRDFWFLRSWKHHFRLRDSIGLEGVLHFQYFLFSNLFNKFFWDFFMYVHVCTYCTTVARTSSLMFIRTGSKLFFFWHLHYNAKKT